MRSGALEALVYTELTHLARTAAPDAAGPGRAAAAAWVTAAYTRLIGRSRAAGTTAIMVASLAAVPVLAWGGYTAAGAASILATLLCAAAGRALPAGGERGRRAARRGGRTGGGRRPSRPLRSAVASAAGVAGRASAEIRASGPARRALLLLAVLVGLSGALDEYVPLLARSTGLSTPAVPLALLVVSAGAVVGGWLAGRHTRHTAPALVAAACCMAAGAGAGHPAGLLLLAVAFGVSEWAGAAAEARLQDSVGEEARATVASFAGFGAESVTVLAFGAYALGSVWLAPAALFALAALPYLAAAGALRRR
ncbi:MFS transporter [Streptomonospora arabica]|uniref:MFS transporter n=1 Tax=Streptomonospora arabica TaxID=412417 RepID=UPI0031D67654